MQNTDFKSLTILEAQAKSYALTYYEIEGETRALPGEVDFNFYLQATDGRQYTLKVSRPGVDVGELDFQASILNHLSTKNLPFNLPEIIPAPGGKSMVEVKDEQGNPRWLRLQKWVPGRMLDEVNPHTPGLLESWGRTAGHFSRALQGFDHPVAHRFYKWNPSEVLFSKKWRAYIRDGEQLEIADYFWNLFENEALPKLPALRQGVNYNDAHVHNLLVGQDLKNPTICGVIDFGDALFTHTVNELAIALAYACMEKPDPLAAATHLIRGYHEIFPLTESEVEVLFPLIGARLLLTVTNAAWNKHLEPDNEYLLISERPAWDLLKKMQQISPALAHFTFRHACGWEPCPMRVVFDKWLSENADALGIVADFGEQQTQLLDLSVSSLDLGNNSNFSTIKNFEKTISRMLENAGASIGYGGYGEVRPFYTTDAYSVMSNAGPQWRTVHLGTDIWAKPETPVLVPFNGKVNSFRDNAGDCNYGPTIILEHEISKELKFFTLYGHLSRESLKGVSIGMPVSKGQQIAAIGSPPENGNWPPHLHFQLMLDMLGMEGDFPGVAFPEEQAVWLSLCPSHPWPLMHSAWQPGSQAASNAEGILHARQQCLGRSLSISYAKPLHIVRGYMQYLYDPDGRRYLDTVNNVPHVGHQHPRVVRVAQRQAGVLNTNTRYLHENIVRFAEELLATFPPELCVVHFVNSGSEANELALRMVRAFTGQRDMVAVEVGYHGNTGGCIDISSYKFDGKGGQGAPPYTQVVPIPDIYRGLYRDEKTAGEKYAGHVRQAIDNIQSAGRNVGGLICESILSCGGQVVLPEGYLSAAYRHIREAGGLCIADEVQVGFGRVGEKFWGFELQGVTPDIVTMGKPIGNGHPLAAVVTTHAVADAFANGMEYFNTFGGNPVSCAIGREVLGIIQDEGLQVHALKTGEYLTAGLKALQQRHPLIGDVRGSGLFLGFELVKDRVGLQPATEAASYLANRMREHGVLMSTDGPFNNVLKIKPPMCFDERNADFLLDMLDKVLAEDFLKKW
jgi:4-aminobutyrate aminotransferase-like enzyme/Ser/Thr protein kinase RdoA (MazF antagonist)